MTAVKHRPQEMDRHVGRRIRERRIMLGMSQQQLAELIGVTFQQAHKYERGINRVSSGRLAAIGAVLGVEPGWFFGGVGDPPKINASDKAVIALVEDYLACSAAHRKAIRTLVRQLRKGTGESNG